MTRPRLILHLGTPKCGSSALQAAFSAQPEHASSVLHMPLHYTAGWPGRLGFRQAWGQGLQQKAARSIYGYATWPSFAEPQMPKAMRKAISALLRRETGPVPVLSNEGWSVRHAAFREVLRQEGFPPVEAVAFVRPPVDWLNAAFWQWGIWRTHDVDDWMAEVQMPYEFTSHIAAWAAIPNVRVHVFPARPDVVARVAALYDITLPVPEAGNTSSPPSLIGFLLRHRQFRPDGLSPGSEFVFQRWCPPLAERSPWALAPHHVQKLRPAAEQSLKGLETLMSAEVFAETMQDPRWQQEKPYHPALQAGRTPVHDPADCAGLYAALVAGVEAVAGELDIPVPALPAACAACADVAAWDAALVPVFEQLLQLDAHWRQRH